MLAGMLLGQLGNVKKQPWCFIVFGWFGVIKLCDGHISSFWTKTLFTRRIDTSPMRTTKTPPTLSMLSSFASVFLFVSCNRRIRSGLHQMTQLLNKKRTNFANTLLSIEEDDDDDHNEVMMWTYIALAAWFSWLSFQFWSLAKRKPFCELTSHLPPPLRCFHHRFFSTWSLPASWERRPISKDETFQNKRNSAS